MSTDIPQKFAALDPARLDVVARMFSALAEPTRLRILQVLQQGPLSVSDIVNQLEVKQANVSKQLGILYAADLIDRERHGNQVRYWISEPLLFDLCSLVCTKIQRDAEAQAKAFGA